MSFSQHDYSNDRRDEGSEKPMSAILHLEKSKMQITKSALQETEKQISPGHSSKLIDTPHPNHSDL